MGIYGSFAHRLIEAQNKSNNLCDFIIESTVYNEYENRKLMLENCINEDDKAVLEAQIEVLQEVAIKDIISKVKEAFNKLKEFVKKIWGIILEKVGKIKEKIRELKNNRKGKSSVKDFEHDDRVKKLIEESTVVQYKIDDKVEYAGYFAGKQIFLESAFSVKQFANDFDFHNIANDVVRNDLDLKDTKEFKELEFIKNLIKGIKVEYVPVTTYNGKYAKQIKSSDDINELFKILDMYSDITSAIETDIYDVSDSKKYIDSSMDSIQKSIDYWEKSANEHDQRSESENRPDSVKNIDKYVAESSRKHAIVYSSIISIIKEINDGYLYATNKFNSALISITTQEQKINNLISNIIE